MKRKKQASKLPNNQSLIDQELARQLEDRLKQNGSKIVVVSAGITSSGLGDERNLREFLLSNEIVEYLRSKGINVIFYLFDDSYDPLTLAQLRVGVKKDEELIKKFEKYCGTPIKLIPDPFGCHSSYSSHFQEEILKRFHSLDIYPCIVDVHSLYERGVMDQYKETIFKRYGAFSTFLSKRFPGYNMKSIFWVLCEKCNRIDSTEIKKVEGEKIKFHCSKCKKNYIRNWRSVKGKFSWKVDTAIKWNLFDTDIEPFTYAYTDPTVGSYFIAKSISERFFKGCYPESINIGRVNMERELSYKLLPSLPREAVKLLFLKDRERDITINAKKIISVAKECEICEGINYYDYVRERLPYDIIQGSSITFKDDSFQEVAGLGREFAKHFLKTDVYPTLPSADKIKAVDEAVLMKVIDLVNAIIEWRHKFPDDPHDKFLEKLNKYLEEHEIVRAEFFPIVRDLFSLEHGIPLSKILYSIPPFLLYELNLRLVKGESKKVKRNVQVRRARGERVQPTQG